MCSQHSPREEVNEEIPEVLKKTSHGAPEPLPVKEFQEGAGKNTFIRPVGCVSAFIHRSFLIISPMFLQTKLLLIVKVPFKRIVPKFTVRRK